MTSRFVASYLARYPAIAAESLEQLAPDAVAEILATLELHDVARLLDGMLPQRAAEVLPELDLDLAAGALGAIGFASARRLLLRLEVTACAAPDAAAMPLRANLERALRFPDGSVGRAMQTRYDSFRLRDKVRRVSGDLARNAQPLPVCFVVDEAGHVVGKLRATDLLGADGSAAVADLMQPCADLLSALGRVSAVREALFAEGVDYLPVGDAERRLIGVLSRADYLRASSPTREVATAPGVIGLWLGLGGLAWQLGARMLAGGEGGATSHEADKR